MPVKLGQFISWLLKKFCILCLFECSISSRIVQFPPEFNKVHTTRPKIRKLPRIWVKKLLKAKLIHPDAFWLFLLFSRNSYKMSNFWVFEGRISGLKRKFSKSEGKQLNKENVQISGEWNWNLKLCNFLGYPLAYICRILIEKRQ